MPATPPRTEEPRSAGRPQPQPTRGARTKTIVGKSKSHDGRKWVYRRGANGKLIPVRPHSSNKKDQAAHREAEAGKRKRAQDRANGPRAGRPFGTLTDQVHALVDPGFESEGRELDGQEKTLQTHKADLNGVFDAFKSELLGHKQAADAAAASQIQASANAANAATQNVAQGMGQVASDTAKNPAGNQYAGDLAQQAGAGAAGVQKTQNAGTDQLRNTATANAGLMDRLGAIMQIEKGHAQNRTQTAINDVRSKKSDLVSQRGVERGKTFLALQERRDNLRQQDTENQLAGRTLLADEQDSLRDYLLGLANNRNQRDIAELQASTSLEINEQDNATSTSNNVRTNRTSRANTRDRVAQSDRNNRRTTQTSRENNIRTNTSRPGAASGTIRIRLSNGRTVDMPRSEARKWGALRDNSVRGIKTARDELARGGDEKQTIKSIARKYKLPEPVARIVVQAGARGRGLTASEKRTLEAHFPRGVVPPGFLSGRHG